MHFFTKTFVFLRKLLNKNIIKQNLNAFWIYVQHNSTTISQEKNTQMFRRTRSVIIINYF